MMSSNNLSILPFYTNLAKQNHRKSYVYEVYPLITPYRKILPFQIIRDTSADTISSVYIYDIDGNAVTGNIVQQMIDTGLKINRYETLGYDVIAYSGGNNLDIDITQGFHYIKVTSGSEIWYSDVFTVSQNISDCLMVEYWNNDSIDFDNGSIVFTNGFKFRVYLPTEIGRPQYPFTEDVDDRDGFEFIEKQISEKEYHFEYRSPEYLLDAMRVVRMCDNIRITSLGDEFMADRFLITPEWLEGGALASVEAEFQTNTILKKIGYIQPEGSGGDFNDDYNNDYKKN